MIDAIKSIIIGIVQGISEWLPISSKTQEIFASHFLLGLSITVAYTFGLFMEMGSIGSALIYFRKDVVRVFKDRFLLKFLVIVTLITGIVGVPLYIISDKLLQNAYNPSIPMMILGAVLIVDGVYIKFTRENLKPREFNGLSLKHMVIIGVAQGLAALPGVSRSGMTVSTMLLLGIKPEDAFRYSYLAYIPAALGAVGTTLLFTRHNVSYAVDQIGTQGLIIALISAFITGILIIGILMRVAKTKTVYIINFLLGTIAILVSVLTLLG
ncbi:undecaprenyl-diphosphatase [Stygiolobus caldivivus]|uniref:Undecaprenyl-diphosphatase n=1 Tax=Stygiolobus caldivivus TaxID=2824673 RepID=A0A8D5U5V9_9CREN|nr:undecaprenyl-diphosphatase [Stygiolobus caldivivus]